MVNPTTVIFMPKVFTLNSTLFPTLLKNHPPLLINLTISFSFIILAQVKKSMRFSFNKGDNMREICICFIIQQILFDLKKKMFCMGNNEQENTHEDSTAKKIENYIFKYDDLLGKGNFGSAYRGYDVNTGRQVAIKVIKMSSIKSKVSQKLLQNEIQILKSLPNHLNLLKCYDVFTSVNNCYIITELCQYDLQQQIKKKGRFQEKQLREIILGVYRGLEELAKHTIIHRDIKIANIFIGKNGVPKIADFGFAVKATDNFKDLNIGSPLYMSPQGLLSNMYGPKTDVWSFGVLLYELINGQTPLERCTTDIELKTQVLQPLRFFNPISYELKQLIQACMTVDEQRRPNIFQLAQFPYIQRLSKQSTYPVQQSLKSSAHQSTQCSQDNSHPTVINPFFFPKELSYDNAVSLLHYCRLLHKVNKKLVKSQKLGQFLLNFSSSLSKAHISSSGTFNEQLNKLRQVLVEYYNKFLMECEDQRRLVSPREVLGQIDLIKRNGKVLTGQCAVEALDAQTKVLVYALQHQNADIFSKNTQAKRLIDSGKLSL